MSDFKHDLDYDAPGSKMFVTNASLITSDGPAGPNIMTAAWTHHISYNPPLVMVNVEPPDATLENILATKKFGVNLASELQNVISSVSGKYTGKKMNKIGLLEELGFKFFAGTETGVPLVSEAALSLELKLLKHEEMGDHVILIGEVLNSHVNEAALPISYSGGKYWKRGENVPKPDQEFLDKIIELAEKYKRD